MGVAAAYKNDSLTSPSEAEAPTDLNRRLEALRPLLKAATRLEALWVESSSPPEIFEAVLRALVAFPDNAKLMASAARVLAKVHEFALAEGLLKRFMASSSDGTCAEGLAMIAKAKGDHDLALAHCCDALSIDPTNFPLHVALAELLFATGRQIEGGRVLDLLKGVRIADAAQNATLAALLWRNGRAAASIARLEASYALGNREESFLIEFLELLTGEMIYDRIRELPEMGVPGTRLFSSSNMLKGHAALARRFTQGGLVAAARERENSADWLSAEDVMATVERAMKARSSLSVIRLGDGEARFLICSDPESREVLSPSQTKAIADVVWRNWFGESFDSIEACELAALRRRFIEAIKGADALGVTDSARFGRDTGHIGYLAYAEQQIDAFTRDEPIRRFNAMAHFEFDRVPTSLSSLLDGLDFLGIVGPHEDLAEVLTRRFSIRSIASYVVPGEVRLWSSEPVRPHYPDVYNDILDSLVVPYPGALFLVGAGLLGKCYCCEIKRRGGIALDVGSVLDGWMGRNTRPGLSSHVPAL